MIVSDIKMSIIHEIFEEITNLWQYRQAFKGQFLIKLINKDI